MGILDDAIREHLDLKRRQGAADDELKRLEDEAFGPPSRPGDPDFPQSEEQALEGSAEETAVAEAPAADALGLEDLEEPVLEQPPQPEAEAAVEPESAEPQPETGGEDGGFFDQSGDDLDLDLDLGEGIEDVGELAVEEPEETGAAEDAPIETLPTVEHHFEEAIDEAEVVEDDDPDAARAMDADTEGEGADEDDEDDVLEETPEFLRDAPEDDELWFEQGEPKDFDF